MKHQILILAFLLLSTVASAEQTLMKTDDIKHIMGEMLSQHVDQKEITAPVLERALQEYIDEFDPMRVYLLESEVNAILPKNTAEQEALLVQYNKNNFSKFNQIDTILQKSIARARQLRHEIMKQPDELLSIKPDLNARESEVKRPFATTESELKNRQKELFAEYLSAEEEKYGKNAVIKHEDKALEAIDKQLTFNENKYLYIDQKGQTLSPEQKDNIFATHILKALAHSLDVHSTFFSPSEANDMKARLEKDFKGIGIVIENTPTGIIISKIVKGSPAEKSGKMAPKDLLLKINGKDVSDAPLESIMEMLRDPSQPTVSLQIKRMKDNQIVTVDLTKAVIPLDDERVTSSYIEYNGGILGTIVMNSFYQSENGVSSERDVKNAILELKKLGKLNGLILDFRENSGGFLIQAVKVAGLFITSGVIVISKYSNGEEKVYRDMDGKTTYDGPLIILTSRATASAAEIVAEALQDYGVAIIVGDDRTYGKGTIQTQTVTNNEATSLFKVTVGKYYTASGKTPQVRGVQADIVVPGRLEDKKVGEIYSDNPLSFDTIPSEVKDDLFDVEPKLLPWYQHYYLPTVQEKKNTWHSMLSQLRKSSADRITKNQTYANYLKEEGDWAPSSYREKNKKEDPQSLEAVNILKDMVRIHEESVANH